MSNKPHILVFPYPAQGHILALLDLTHQLALRSFTITIIITPKNLPTLNPLLSAHPTSIHTLILPFPSHPNVPPGVENVRELGNSGNVHIISALSKLREPIVRWFESHPSPPVAIISDFFLGWTLQLSHRLGIPRIAFHSTSAFLTAVLDVVWENLEAVRGRRVVEFSGIPGAPSFKEEHLPSIFRRYRESDPDWEIVRESQLANSKSWGCVLNTFHALEGPYLDYTTKTKSEHRRVFVVGPLSLLGLENGVNLNRSHSVLNWLDECPDGSVVYICFGSQKLLSREQMEALAIGLERSDTRFIWVVKVGTNQQTEEGYGVVPDGFEDRVSGRGVVIKGWVPQAAILSHGAVGGFLSHCGWNSVSEALVAGVMILGWPMEADQFVNAKLLVEDKGAAVRVCEGADSIPDPDELGRVIRKSMSMDSPEKRRAMELRDEALKSVSEGGSSFKELDEFVETLSKLAQGHILPLLDLTHQLALRSFTITIIITPKNLPTLNPLLSAHPTSIHTLILPFPSHPKVPPGVENVRELGNSGNALIMSALSKLLDPIVEWFQSHPSPPVAFISDFFLGWTLRLSRRLGIPIIAFYSSGAFVTAVNNFCWQTPEVVRGRSVVEFSEIPGTPSFKEEHLPSNFRHYRESDPDWEIVKESYLANIASWGCVFNSFHALEGPYLGYIRRKSEHARVFAVGPLSLIGPGNGVDRVNPYPSEDHSVFRWLDHCPNESVLYVCFGSQTLLKREQMEALAIGLERSNTRFIWAVKAGTTQQTGEGYGVVPDGFEDRVSGRGLVLKGWVPQVAILSHGAIGGFLSHCGWNSVLEALVAGVMIVGWPMTADQFVNAKLLIEDKGVAVGVCEGSESIPDPNKLGQVIKESMRVNSPQKGKAKEMRDEALKSVSDVGKSSEELDAFVDVLAKLGVNEVK
ncbi:UDP-glycosyltransferase 89A2-like [Senna tora]|uniref:UDP-glycosyltransferase 89A2-like n=1 Tax=Senna tora TaxID=362788 RepID=A0A834W578_9FABA|nr:UDP-glycosyltransferase 89A2-like [Senna tora]